MQYTIYESDNVEPDPVPGLKRSFTSTPSNAPAEGNFGGASIEPYVPPVHNRHLEQHRQHMSHHAFGSLSENWPNSSIAEDPDSIVYKRSDPDTPMGDVDAEFSLSQVFECPDDDDAEEAQLPEFRCKCQMLLMLMLMHDARLTITDNCRNAFYDSAVGSKGQSSRVPGICNNIASFMATRAIAPGTGIELTLDPQEGRTGYRRDSVCTRGFCQSEQKSLIDQI